MIRVALVEDDRELRKSLIEILSRSEYDLVGVFERAELFINQVDVIQPDVVVMDINLPGINGIECVKQVKAKCPQLQFIMCTVYEDDDNLFDSLKAGATGYILKNTSAETLINAIADVSNGGSPMTSRIARRVLQTFQQSDTNDTSEILTIREKEIIEYLSKGLRYKEIAAKLFISVETVRTHIRNIYEKLHVQSRTEALNKLYGK